MSVVVDTTVLVDVLRGDAEALTYVDRLAAVSACTAAVRRETLDDVLSRDVPLDDG